MELLKHDYKALLDNLYDGVYFVDTQRRIHYWNKAAEKITGFTAKEVVGARCGHNILNHLDAKGNPMCENGCPLTETISDGRSREAEAYLHHKRGHRIPVAVRISPIFDANGKIIGGIELFNDISQKAATMIKVHELEALALLDGLTRLANRTYVEMELKARFEEMLRYGWPFGFLFMDIDRFKRINDSFGHDAGDRVLKAVSNTFLSGSRPFDLYGRWGGEEFVGLIRNVDGQQLYMLSNRLVRLIKESFVTVNGSKIQITVSCGATMARSGDDIASIVKRSDHLMYESKQAGGDRVSMDPQSQSEPD